MQPIVLDFAGEALLRRAGRHHPAICATFATRVSAVARDRCINGLRYRASVRNVTMVTGSRCEFRRSKQRLR
jgi:hypothetical protein